MTDCFGPFGFPRNDALPSPFSEGLSQVATRETEFTERDPQLAFNSFAFLVFFSLVLALYFAAPSPRRWIVLLPASLYFYASWNPPFVFQLVAAIAITYFVALRIARSSHRTSRICWLSIGLGILSANLFIFKYYNFFNESVRALMQFLSMPYAVPSLSLLLPIGISFYTFQLLSYLIDVYRGTLAAERNLAVFALYVSFFPQLVAGPIERASNLLPQLYQSFEFDYARVRSGLLLMAWGLFKKVVVADRVAPFVLDAYKNPQDHDGVTMVIGTLFFAVQVYCDFSAYSDIAIGCAQTLGYTLMRNFNHPYFAVSIIDFWKRWHISLSTWLSDYIYTPLARGNFFGLKWYYTMLLSSFVTFLLSGLWHGAKWTFVLWGALHGLYVVSSLLTQKWRRNLVNRLSLNEHPLLLRALRVSFTFTLVCLSYIPFRAETLHDAIYIYAHLGTGWASAASTAYRQLWVLHGVECLLAAYGIVVICLVEVLQQSGALRGRIVAGPPWLRWGLYYGLTMSIILAGAFYGNAQDFIYFQF